MVTKKNNLVIGIYFHPEAFPPTLNAIGELSSCFDHITIVYRPHLPDQWAYPPNVMAMASGNSISARQQEAAPLWKKIGFFARFVSRFLRQCIRKKPSVILVYDILSLHAYHIIKKSLRFKHKVWYHNHDVSEPGLLRTFSISWFAARTEKKAFSYLDIFSLPSNDRLKYFPMQLFKGHYFFIPNYPAVKFYRQFYRPRILEERVRIIFQGHVGPYHGIEEIIPLLGETWEGRRLQLVLKGPCLPDYKNHIMQLAAQHQVSGRIEFIGVTPYAEVPAASATCHIGIGILAKKDVMNTTLGTASNKLYEYAAVGLPVLYYDSEDFTKHLAQYAWAVPAGLSSEDIAAKLKWIIQLYSQLSEAAHDSFMQELNFETGFKPVKDYLTSQ